MANSDENILDLQALAPTSAKIKLPDGKTIEVQPPKTEQVLRIGFYSQQMREVRAMGEKNPDEFTEEMRAKLQSIMDSLEEQIKIVVPDLKDYNLNLKMITTMAEFITEMGAPGEIEKAKEQGAGEATSPKAPSNPTPELPTS